MRGQFVLRGSALPADIDTLSYRAVEEISAPFTVDIRFKTKDDGFDVLTALRTAAVLTVINEQGQTRFYHGVVERARFVKMQAENLIFEVRLMPELQALAHRENCRIFQDKSIVDVVTEIFNEAGFGDRVQWDVTGTYAAKEFIVQYRESEFNFVSRVFEQAGLFYFFEHSEDQHKLIVSDNPEGFVLLDAPQVEVQVAAAGSETAVVVQGLARTRSLRTGSIHLLDYDFKAPAAPPESSLPPVESWSMPFFEYPGGFVDGSEGALLASARMRELRHDSDILTGSSEAVDLRVGAPFVVDGADEEDLNGSFVPTRLVSWGHQHNEHDDRDVACKNEFRAIPEGAPFAAPRRAKRVRIHGVQTAIVTGHDDQDQTICVDEFGRIKVRFYWDRVGQQDENSSCWIRTNQLPLGGSMILPRVNWEVSIAFLDGDPDRPMMLGKVYNAENQPPDALPGAKASGSLKSMSSPAGAGHNLIGACDTGGSQGFNIHAQKDLNITTEHDFIEEVGVDEEHNVTKNVSNETGVNDSASVGGNQSLNVGANHSQKIGGSQSISIGGNDDSNSTADTQETVGGARSYTVSGNQITICNGITQNVTGDYNVTVGAVEVVGSVASISDNIAATSSSTVGAIRVHLVNGTHGETVGGLKNQTSAAAEIHINGANHAASCDAATTMLIGGLHYRKVTGAYTVKAPMITLVGATGDLKGGKSSMKLGGGPVVMKGKKIVVKSALSIKMGASLKEG
ncbi:MAG: type VI secretion system tip protein VgrG [Polyangiaceae bacterium]|nr:type VI secretion system tip protein VgrG [Polyangiaceae bacterium]